MFDLFLTLAVVYFAYRGYNWYVRVQEQVKAGPRPPHQVHQEPPTAHPNEDDYIDYEEIK